uniref:Translation elongation factor P/YeiP central domain-containing protein n=1 Tax=Oryza glumipatula TaxID=40148 RepID=A0A0E0BN03_9ORYZ
MASLRLRHLSPSGATAPPSSFAQLRRPSSCLAGPRPLRSRLTRVYALSSNDIRVGTNLEVDGAPWKIPEASISKETKQFTYKDGAQFVFMDLTTFEESRLNESDVGDRQKWLKEGMDCNLLYWNGRIIDFDLPITVRLTVTDTDPGQGDSAQGGTKPATVETGAVVTVPSFVNVGDDILIDSRTGQYMNRA